MSRAKRPAPRLSFRWADPKTRGRLGEPDVYHDSPVSPERDPVMAAAQAALPGEMLAVRAPRRRAAPRSRAAALAALDRAGESALSGERGFDHRAPRKLPGETALNPRRYGARVYYWSEGGELLATEIGGLTESQATRLRDTVSTGAIWRAVRGVIGFFVAIRRLTTLRETRAQRERRQTFELSDPRPSMSTDLCVTAWSPDGKLRAHVTDSDAVDAEIWVDCGSYPSHWSVDRADRDGYRMPPLWAGARVVPLLTAAPVRMPDEIEEQAA